MTISTVFILVIVIFVALIFTLTNGLHDASSVVATFISCRAANPIQAISLAAFCGFIGALTSGSAVANTISGIVTIPTETALLKVLLAAMIGAVIWNLVTWELGFPSSSTHALVGGLNKSIKKIQWVIAGLLAYSYGANDTQKTVGIIWLALASASYSNGQVGLIWIKGLAGAVMFAGTLLGGWPIMKTIGRDIYTIRPIHSLNFQLSSGGCLVLATALGAPVSTTHVVVGSVIGVGGADEFRMVNWKIGKEIIIA